MGWLRRWLGWAVDPERESDLDIREARVTERERLIHLREWLWLEVVRSKGPAPAETILKAAVEEELAKRAMLAQRQAVDAYEASRRRPPEASK